MYKVSQEIALNSPVGRGSRYLSHTLPDPQGTVSPGSVWRQLVTFGSSPHLEKVEMISSSSHAEPANG